jgi:molybdate transport system substrate-binding protein
MTRLFAALLLASAMTGSIALAQPARGETVTIYAAAVARTPLGAIAAEYEKATGNTVRAIYDTAGASVERFRADPEAALLITNILLIRRDEAAGALKDGTSRLLGRTVAAVAVTPGAPKPDVSTAENLKAALLAARRVAVSDPSRGATVGTHFMNVIEALGVKDRVLPKVTLSSNGVETIRLVVEGQADIGVSQSSEILQGSPDAMAGPFPKEFELATDFALWHRNALSPASRDFVAVLMAPASRERFAAEGVMPPPAP